MTTILMTDQRVTIPAGFDGIIVRIGLAISDWGTRRAKRSVIDAYPRLEQPREQLSADLIYYRMR